MSKGIKMVKQNRRRHYTGELQEIRGIGIYPLHKEYLLDQMTKKAGVSESLLVTVALKRLARWPMENPAEEKLNFFFDDAMQPGNVVWLPYRLISPTVRSEHGIIVRRAIYIVEAPPGVLPVYIEGNSKGWVIKFYEDNSTALDRCFSDLAIAKLRAEKFRYPKSQYCCEVE